LCEGGSAWLLKHLHMCIPDWGKLIPTRLTAQLIWTINWSLNK
jgi:hypothetical protein